jgi:hypothetical protein
MDSPSLLLPPILRPTCRQSHLSSNELIGEISQVSRLFIEKSGWRKDHAPGGVAGWSSLGDWGGSQQAGARSWGENRAPSVARLSPCRVPPKQPAGRWARGQEIRRRPLKRHGDRRGWGGLWHRGRPPSNVTVGPHWDKAASVPTQLIPSVCKSFPADSPETGVWGEQRGNG